MSKRTRRNTGVKEAKPATKETVKPEIAVYELRLYVAGQTPKSLVALANLRRICEEHLQGKYTIEVIDLLKQPQLARGDEIVALPTLVRKLPEPVRKIVGDLSNKEKVLVGLQLRSRGLGVA